MKIALLSLALLAMVGGSAEAAARSPIREAFVATFGQPLSVKRVVDRPARPPGCDCSGTAKQVALTVTPDALIPLGGGRYALVSWETDGFDAHVDPGALPIAILDLRHRRWRLQHLWNEVAWTGDHGHPADYLIARKSVGAPPIVFAVHDALHQGEHDTTSGRSP